MMSIVDHETRVHSRKPLLSQAPALTDAQSEQSNQLYPAMNVLGGVVHAKSFTCDGGHDVGRALSSID
jgi:hypothetical protein